MRTTLSKHLLLSDLQYASLLNIAERKEVNKKTTLFRPDKTNSTLFFLERGLLRGYRLIEGIEYTHHFFTDQWFATDFQSYLTEKPGSLYIESLTDATYYAFQKKDLRQLFKEAPVFERLGRIIAENAYLSVVDRMIDLQTTNLKERYERLIQKHPELILKVPQRMLASYLGVTEQSLSRIKFSLL